MQPGDCLPDGPQIQVVVKHLNAGIAAVGDVHNDGEAAGRVRYRPCVNLRGIGSASIIAPAREQHGTVV